MIARNKYDDANKIIDYLKENASDKYIMLKTSDAASILGSGNTYAVGIMDIVKMNEHIDFKRMKKGKGNQPFEFKYINIKEQEFDNINKTDVDLIVKKLNDISINKDEINNILLVLDKFLSFIYSNSNIDKNTLFNLINSKLDIDIKVLERYYDILESCFILQEENNIVYYSLNNNKIQDNEQIKKDIEQNTIIYKSLIDNLNNFQGFMNNFKEYMKDTTKDIIQIKGSNLIEKDQENEKLKKELQNGILVLNKYENEFKNINQVLQEKNNIIRKDKLIIKTLEERNNILIQKMQRKMEILFAEVIKQIDEFISLPSWKQSAESRKHFKDNIASYIKNTNSEILTWNDNPKDNE